MSGGSTRRLLGRLWPPGCCLLLGAAAACRPSPGLSAPAAGTPVAWREVSLVVPPTTWPSPAALRALDVALRETVAQLGGPPSATLTGFGEDQVPLLRAALERAGVAPSRIAAAPPLVAAAGGGRIRLRVGQAEPVPCPSTLAETSPYDIDSTDLMPAASCRQAGNLARMLADPGDLAAPSALAPLDAASLLGPDDQDAPSRARSGGDTGQKAAGTPPTPGGG